MGLVSKHFLQYPSMERQDLTQGQLGSFKFTPVDAVHHDVNMGFLTASAQQEMIAQLQSSAQRATAMASETHSHQSSLRSSNTGFASLTATTNLTADVDFFDKRIKADIGNSRLKYGPAALRSAVESHSPEKTRAQHQPLNSLHSFLFSNTDMNPTASSFASAAPTSSFCFDDANITIQALGRSLAAEQHAHHATQINLEDALRKLADVEADMEKTMKQNKSLISAVDMLGGIIKHNQHKLSKTNVTPIKRVLDGKPVEVEEPVNQVSPIIYDVLERQRAQITSSETDCTSVADSVQVHKTQPIPDENIHLFNLDLLKTPAQDDNAGSSLSTVLRRHFFESSEEDHAGRLSRAITPLVRADKLVSISPEELEKTPTRPFASLRGAPQKLQQGASPLPTNLSKQTATLLEGPVLTLPASFLAKYKAPTKDGKVAINDSPVTTLKAETNTKSTPSNPTHSPPSSTASSGLSSPMRQRIGKLPQIFDLRIRWKVKRDNPIFQDEKEKKMALGHPKSEVNLRSSFWDHPVRYVEYADENLFRTVMIDHIPEDSSVKAVLAEISGGSLEKIELFPAIGKATNFMTARIVFNHELSATTVANHARDHGMKIKGQPVRAWQVLTQTYPKNTRLYEDVFVHCYTRVLLVTNITDHQLGTIQGKLARLRKSIVEYRRTYDDLPMIEFTSVAAAVHALDLLMNDPDLGGAELDFENDPCSEPYPQYV